MEFASFAEHAAETEAIEADLETVSAVAALFEGAGEDLAAVARFVQGRVFPAHGERKLDVGPSTCYEALARAAGPNVSPDDIESALAEVGDIGDVAAELELGGQTGLAAFGAGEDALTVAEVFDELGALAGTEGEGSHDDKVAVLLGLFKRADPAEARYLARLVLGEMRIGVGEGTVRDAITEAFGVPAESVERALQVSNDYGRVAVAARDEDVEGLDAMSLEVGRPVQAMLAQAGTAADALESWDEVAVQTKFDGARVQLHVGEKIEIYSRNMENVTDALPEVVAFAAEHLDAPAILDGEVVAVDDDGAPLPFQEVLRRFRRKHDIEEARENVAVELRAFDCLHAGGEDLLDEPLRVRHDRLSGLLDAGVSELRLTDSADEIADAERRALEAGHEGIMLKDPDSAYSPGQRGRNWLKRKPDVETLDLVVTGAEWGEGRRADFFGTFEVAACDGDRHAPVGKVATGITDEELADLTDLLEPHVTRESGQEIRFAPNVVFEVGYEEIQTSPTYESGYALRFPRFLGVRTDKSPADADSLERVERLARDADTR